MKVEQGRDRNLLVGVEYFTRLCKVVDMFIGIGFKGLEEGRGCFYEEHTLSPACWHRGRDGEDGGWEGEKGVEGKKVAVCVVWGGGRFVRTRSCSCWSAMPFPSFGGRQARENGQSLDDSTISFRST